MDDSVIRIVSSTAIAMEDFICGLPLLDNLKRSVILRNPVKYRVSALMGGMCRIRPSGANFIQPWEELQTPCKLRDLITGRRQQMIMVSP